MNTSGKAQKNQGRQLKYQRVESEIRQFTRALPVGAKLPSERNLAVTYDCNFLTVRKALKRMVDDGTITRRVGSGTFVAERSNNTTNKKNTDSQGIGILVYEQGNSYSQRILQAIAHSGLNRPLDLQSTSISDFGESCLAQAAQLKSEGCVALILPWFPHGQIADVRSFAAKSPLPICLPLPIPGFEHCYFEEHTEFGNAGTEELCHYFRLLGHKHIAFLGPDSEEDIFLQKILTTYICYMSRFNLPSPCGLVAPGAQAMDQLAKRWKTYRGKLAIVSYDDEHALRFITAMHKLGLTAPRDFCIIGFNNTEASYYSDPPLSTIRQNFDYIGTRMLDTALALAEGNSRPTFLNAKKQLLVRFTCGGRDKIDDTLRSKIPTLDIVLDDTHHAPKA
ncbi:MAG: substrate-binding domain-containing protein [Chthoniobacterales bacterium]